MKVCEANVNWSETGVSIYLGSMSKILVDKQYNRGTLDIDWNNAVRLYKSLEEVLNNYGKI